MIIEGVKSFLEGFPMLRNKKLGIEFLGEKPERYAIFSLGKSSVIKKYTDGNSLNQFVFAIRLRYDYGNDAVKNARLNEFCEELGVWLAKCTKENKLPHIGYERSVLSIELLSSGKIKNTNYSDCVYEAECRIIYYQKI